MTRPYRRIQRVPLAPFCVLLGSGFLASCSVLENAILPPLQEALGSIKDTIEPPPPPAPRASRTARHATSPPASERPQARTQSAVTQEQGRCHDVPSCERLLRKLTEGPDRSWIARPDTPEGLLTGVRMFAFRTLRPKLTCAELGLALEQLRGVPAALRPPPPGSSPEDIARTNRLAAEVHDELRAENEARCRAASAPPARPAAPPPNASDSQKPAPGQPPVTTHPPSVTTQPPPSPPQVTTQPPASGQPTITTQPPASSPPVQPQPQVTIPGQPQGRPEKQ